MRSPFVTLALFVVTAITPSLAALAVLRYLADRGRPVPTTTRRTS